MLKHFVLVCSLLLVSAFMVVIHSASESAPGRVIDANEAAMLMGGCYTTSTYNCSQISGGNCGTSAGFHITVTGSTDTELSTTTTCSSNCQISNSREACAM
jgi:hypothetical protein